MRDRHLVALNALVSLVLAALGVVASSLVSYQLGPADRGILGVLALVVSISVTLGAFGAPDAILVRVAKFGQPSRAYSVGLSLVAGAGAGVVGAVAAAVVARLLDEGSASVSATFVALCASTTAMWMVPNAMILGRQSVPRWNLVRLAGGVAWVVAVGIGVAAERTGLHGADPILLIALAFAGLNLAVWLLAVGLVDFDSEDTTASAPKVRSLLAFGLPTSLALALMLLNTRVDQFFVAKESSAVMLGQYVAAAAYASLLVVAVQALGNLAYPKIAAAQEDPMAVIRTYARGAVMLSVLGLGVLWLAAPTMLRILNGPDFPEAPALARVLLFGAAFQAVASVLEQGLKGLSHPRRYLLGEAAGLLATIVLVVALGTLGVFWIAVGSSLGSLATLLAVVIILKRLALGDLRPAECSSERESLQN
jgi:O-antigen/teichoic acid export membrane protein